MDGRRFTRREFLRTAGAVTAMTAMGGLPLDALSEPAVQSAPFGLRPHEPLLQNSPGAHSSLVLHEVKQVSPLQAKGLQVREREAAH